MEHQIFMLDLPIDTFNAVVGVLVNHSNDNKWDIDYRKQAVEISEKLMKSRLVSDAGGDYIRVETTNTDAAGLICHLISEISLLIFCYLEADNNTMKKMVKKLELELIEAFHHKLCSEHIES